MLRSHPQCQFLNKLSVPCTSEHLLDAQPPPPQEDDGPDSLRVEASLLVLHDPSAAPAARARAPAGAAAAAPAPPPPPPRVGRLPASAWHAMSALAGAALPPIRRAHME